MRQDIKFRKFEGMGRAGPQRTLDERVGCASISLRSSDRLRVVSCSRRPRTVPRNITGVYTEVLVQRATIGAIKYVEYREFRLCELPLFRTLAIPVQFRIDNIRI